MSITSTRKLAQILIIILASGHLISLNAQTMTFVHPGAINSKNDLDYVKSKIAANQQPWLGKFNQMLTFAVASTNTSAPVNNDNGQKADAQKAYANALAWYYTGNTTYAQNAINILNVWGNTFTGYSPTVGQNQLQGGWIGALLGPAAEIMRGYSGWAPADMAKVQTMFKTAFYPVLNTMSTWNGNVDLTQIDAMMSIAVFCEDQTEFNLGIQRLNARNPIYFYLTTEGTPSNRADWFAPTSWVNGLTQETCRDNGHHAQYAMASAFHAAEVAWNQGVDVFTPNTTRYTATLELMAKQIQSGLMQGTCTNNTATTDLYATWELGYNHYHNRKGIALPNTLTIITNKIRPSGQSDWNIFFETLTHNLDGYTPCPKPNLGADQSICGQSSINLLSNVTATAKTISWYKDNVLIAGQSGTSYSATASGTYKVVVDSINCSFNDEIVISSSLLVSLGSDLELCNPASYTLDAGNASIPNVQYSWNTGATSQIITATKAGTYSVTVSAPGCAAANSSVNVTSKLLNVTSDTICTAGPVSLSVAGTGTYNWYDAPTNGNLVHTGSSFSPSIVSSTTYYIEDGNGFQGSLGKVTKGAGTTWNVGTADFGASDKINKVTVLQALTLKSIAVYVTTANSSVTINFKQGATTAFTKTFPNLAVGKQTLALDFNLTAGNYTIDAVGSTGTLSFEASGGSFPYTTTDYISFTYNENWQSTWYGIYYDWVISTASPCLRTPIFAVIDSNNPSCQGITGNHQATITASFNMYPNPAKDELKIKTTQGLTQNQSEILLFNSFGQHIHSIAINSQNDETTMDVSALASGLYYMQIGNQTQKLIIQE